MKKLMFLAVVIILGGSAEGQEVNIVTRKNEGIFNITQLGYLPGMGNISYDGELRANQSQAYRIRTLFGYFITPRFSVALGAGADAYQDPSYKAFKVSGLMFKVLPFSNFKQSNNQTIKQSNLFLVFKYRLRLSLPPGPVFFDYELRYRIVAVRSPRMTA